MRRYRSNDGWMDGRTNGPSPKQQLHTQPCKILYDGWTNRRRRRSRCPLRQLNWSHQHFLVVSCRLKCGYDQMLSREAIIASLVASLPWRDHRVYCVHEHGLKTASLGLPSVLTVHAYLLPSYPWSARSSSLMHSTCSTTCVIRKDEQVQWTPKWRVRKQNGCCQFWSHVFVDFIHSKVRTDGNRLVVKFRVFRRSKTEIARWRFFALSLSLSSRLYRLLCNHCANVLIWVVWGVPKSKWRWNGSTTRWTIEVIKLIIQAPWKRKPLSLLQKVLLLSHPLEAFM